MGAAYLKGPGLPPNLQRGPAPKLPRPRPPQNRESELRQNLRTR